MSEWREQSDAAAFKTWQNGMAKQTTFSQREVLRGVVDAVEPIIRADERESIARQIEARARLWLADGGSEECINSLLVAVAIARGESDE